MDIQVIEIEKIILEWSPWYSFQSIIDLDLRLPVHSGVYEVSCSEQNCRLTIGKGNNLDRRIRKSLILGQYSHSTRKRLLLFYPPPIFNGLLVRWALTTRPLCVEEELKKIHFDTHGSLPTHTVR